jgi:hypothetical protein
VSPFYGSDTHKIIKLIYTKKGSQDQIFRMSGRIDFLAIRRTNKLQNNSKFNLLEKKKKQNATAGKNQIIGAQRKGNDG